MTISSKNVLILRTLISLCKNDKKLPHVFYDLGYTQILIDKTVRLPDSRTVEPDLVISSRQQNHSIVWESKSGRNIENNQAKKLAQITPNAFTEQLMLNVKTDDSFVFDIAYACDGKQCQNIRVDLDRLSTELTAIGKFPVVGFFENKVTKHSGGFRNSTIDGILSAGIAVDLMEIPVAYLPFDKDCSLSEIAPFVVRSIVSYVTSQEARFSSEQIAKESYGSGWEYIASNRTKNEIVSKVEQILSEGIRNELRGYLSKAGRGKMRAPKWQLSYSNVKGGAYPAGRLKKLQKRCKEFVNRLRVEESGVKQLRLPLFLEDEAI
jgi:hypothetical protein